MRFAKQTRWCVTFAVAVATASLMLGCERAGDKANSKVDAPSAVAQPGPGKAPPIPPASPLAENAQYWLGEAYYVTRSYDDAGTAFRTVLQKYPQSRKAPDAALKLGYTQYELKRYADARKTLQEVAQKYPDSDASRLAAERLKRIPANAPKS